MEEAPVHRDGEDGDEGSGDHRGFGVAGGIEGARVDSLHRPEGEGDGKDGEELRDDAGVGAIELAAAEEVHEPGGEGNHPGGDDHTDGEEAGDGAADRGGEVVGSVLLEERSEERQRGGPGGRADDVEGCAEEALGVGDERDAAELGRGEELEEDAVEHDQRDADHKRQGELEPLKESGRAEADDGVVAQAGAEGAQRVEQSGADDDSAERAPGEGEDAKTVMQQQSAEDDSCVVDHRRAGLVEEYLAHLQARAHHAADKKEELRGQ